MIEVEDIFKREDWSEVYFAWADFPKCNCILHLNANGDGDTSQHSNVDIYVDFLTQTFPKSQPKRSHSYLEVVDIRVDILRKVLLYGQSWKQIIKYKDGADKNVHNFYEHFCTKLPTTPPDWVNCQSGFTKTKGYKSTDLSVLQKQKTFSRDVIIRQVLISFITIGSVLIGCWFRYTLKYYHTNRDK